MKILFVAKDMGGANVACPLASKCREQGHEVTVVTEGLASGIFERAGFPPHFKGTVNVVTEPFMVDPFSIIKSVKPDAVVTALGSPINLEQSFGAIANALDIPLVECVDFWNGTGRSKALPDIVLALDEFDASLSRERHPSAQVRIVGNPGVTALGTIAPCQEVLDMRQSHFVFAYVGGGERTADEIEFLLACLAKTGGNWRLIPRFHSKHAKLPSGQGSLTFGEAWAKMLEPVADRLVYLPDAKSDSVVVSSDATFASWSTLLTTAASNGHVAGVLAVPSAMAELKELTDLDQVPIAALGCASLISEPVDLSSLVPASSENLAKLKPYDPTLAYELMMRSLQLFSS